MNDSALCAGNCHALDTGYGGNQQAVILAGFLREAETAQQFPDVAGNGAAADGGYFPALMQIAQADFAGDVAGDGVGLEIGELHHFQIIPGAQVSSGFRAAGNGEVGSREGGFQPQVLAELTAAPVGGGLAAVDQGQIPDGRAFGFTASTIMFSGATTSPIFQSDMPRNTMPAASRSMK